MEARGESTKGFRAHVRYVQHMSSLKVYTTEALVSYDREMRQRAIDATGSRGQAVFTGADTDLTNRCLGISGTIAYAKLQEAPRGASSYGGLKQSGSRSNNNKPFSGWRKIAAENKLCFRFQQAMQCDGCKFKHECACGVTAHGMLACPTTKYDK